MPEANGLSPRPPAASGGPFSVLTKCDDAPRKNEETRQFWRRLCPVSIPGNESANYTPAGIARSLPFSSRLTDSQTDSTMAIASAGTVPVRAITTFVRARMFRYYMELPRKGARAYLLYDGNHWILEKGAELAEPITKSMQPKYYRKRRGVQAKAIRNEIGRLVTTYDVYCSSKSEAACIVEGGSRSGPDVWRPLPD